VWVEIPDVTDGFVAALDGLRRQAPRRRSRALPWVLGGLGLAGFLLATCCIAPIVLKGALQFMRNRAASEKVAAKDRSGQTDKGDKGVDWKELNRLRGDDWFKDPGEKFIYTVKVPAGTRATVRYTMRSKAENGLQIFDVASAQLKAMHTTSFGQGSRSETLEAPPGKPATFYLVGRHKLGSDSSQPWNVSEYRIDAEGNDRIALCWKDASGPEFDKICVEIVFVRPGS
jgi:hypothetical protein